MPSITISEISHPTLIDRDFANGYLGADAEFATVWDETDDTQKDRCIVSASRALQGFKWRGAAPDPEGTIDDRVKAATAVMAELIAVTPALASGREAGRDIRREKAGEVEFEYFGAIKPGALPSRIGALIGDLLSIGASKRGPYRGGVGKEPCSDVCENGLTGGLG